MLSKKIVIVSIFFVLLIALALIFRPVPTPSPENTIMAYGTIEDVFEAGDRDVVIKLKGDDRFFFINEGLKNGLTLTELQTKLSGQNVEIHYVEHWTLLDRLSKFQHIAKVDVNSMTLYSAGN